MKDFTAFLLNASFIFKFMCSIVLDNLVLLIIATILKSTSTLLVILTDFTSLSFSTSICKNIETYLENKGCPMNLRKFIRLRVSSYMKFKIFADDSFNIFRTSYFYICFNKSILESLIAIKLVCLNIATSENK